MKDFTIKTAMINTINAFIKMKGLRKAPFMYPRAVYKLLYKIITGKELLRDIIICTTSFDVLLS